MSGMCYRSLCVLAVSLLVVTSFGCGEKSPEAVPKASLSPDPGAASGSEAMFDESAALAVQLQADEANTDSPAVSPESLYPEVLIATSLGDIRVRLNAKDAPATVRNFLLDYVDRGFYDQTIVHYVDSGFMMAAGGYGLDAEPKPARTPIRHEGQGASKNLRGTIAMVRHAEYIHSATSQFFINLADNPSLDYQEVAEGEDDSKDPAGYGYCVFGEVIEGLDVVDKIGGTPVTDKADLPRTPATQVVIRKISRIR